MMGIKQVHVEGIEVRIVCGLLEATAEQIEAPMREAGARLRGGWPDRLRRAWVHYTEGCEAAIMEVSDGGHHHTH